MEDVKPYSAEIKSRGQLTIPKRVRESGAMEEGQSVTIIPIGDSLLATPKTLKLEDARRELPVLTAVTGDDNVREVGRNLIAKLPGALPSFRSCLKTIGFEIVPLPPRKSLPPLAGLTSEMDLPVLASAVLGKADVLVTGDKRGLLKTRTHTLPFAVLSPAEFLDGYLPGWLKRL